MRYAIAQASYIVGGGRYVRGGSRALSDRLAALIVQAGGVVESGREADELLVRGHGVIGVGHHARDGGDARVDMALLVFGNAAPQILAEMLPEARRAAFLAPYAGRHQSIFLWTASFGLSHSAHEFGVRHCSTFVIPDWMHSLSQMREAAAAMGGRPGERMPPYVFVDYSQIDSGLNKAGPSLLTFCGVDRLENWASSTEEEKKARKEEWMHCLIADIDRRFPGMASVVAHREMSTAETMQRHLNSPGGLSTALRPREHSFRTSCRGRGHQ